MRARRTAAGMCRDLGGGRLLVAAVCVWLIAVSGSSPGASAVDVNAEQILSDSGFHGGLIVLVGRWDAGLAVSLAKAPNVLVHGLVSDRETLPTVRGRIRKAGLYGRVSAAWWQGPALPYADGMVNLLLVPDERTGVSAEEINRALAPLGAAWVRHNDAWQTRRKPWPADVDEWSHARYDATGNAVSKDKRVGPPRFLQWEALPRWNRGVKTIAWSRRGDASSSSWTIRTSRCARGRGP